MLQAKPFREHYGFTGTISFLADSCIL